MARVTPRSPSLPPVIQPNAIYFNPDIHKFFVERPTNPDPFTRQFQAERLLPKSILLKFQPARNPRLGAGQPFQLTRFHLAVLPEWFAESASSLATGLVCEARDPSP